MRIDYSEPKKSYVSGQGSSRPRKEPAGLFKAVVVITAVIAFSGRFRHRLALLAEIRQEVIPGRERTEQPGEFPE